LYREGGASYKLTRLHSALPLPPIFPIKMINWESDEITLKNELKLIDDSYYRVYDDNDYDIWKERMLSIIV
jgi:hypothetical protein